MKSKKPALQEGGPLSETNNTGFEKNSVPPVIGMVGDLEVTISKPTTQLFAEQT